MLLYKLSIRNIKKNKMRFFLLSLTFMFSALTIMVSIFFREATLKSREYQLREQTSNRQIIITSNDEKEIYFNPEKIYSGKTVQGIDYLTSRCTGKGSINKVNNVEKQEIPLYLVGVQYEKQAKIYKFDLSKDERIDSLKGKVIISEELAKREKLNIGDNIVISNENKTDNFRITAFAKPKGIFSNIDTVVLDIEDVQNLLDKPQMVTSVGATINNLQSINDINNELKKIYGEDYKVENTYDLEFFKSFVTSISMAITIFAVFNIFLTLVLTYTTFKSLIFERTNIIGTLRSIGFSKLGLVVSIFAENIIVSFLSILIGISLSIPILRILIRMFVGNYIILDLSTSKIVLVFLLLLSIGIISILNSVFEMLKISVVDIIRGNIYNNGKANNKYIKNVAGIVSVGVSIVLLFWGDYTNKNICFIFGIIFFVIGVLLLINIFHKLIYKMIYRPLSQLGIEMKLALKEIKSSFKNFIEPLIIFALVISICYFSFSVLDLIKGSVAEVYKNIDIIMYTDNPKSDLSGEISEINGVEKVVAQLQMNIDDVKGCNIDLRGVDGAEYRQILFEKASSGDIQQMFKNLNSDNNIIISSTFAKKANCKLGDLLSIKTDNGIIQYKVIGILNSFENMGKVQFISKENMNRNFSSKRSVMYCIKVDSNEEINNVKEKLSLKWGQNVNIVTVDDMKRDNNKNNEMIFTIVKVMLIIAVAVSIIDLTNNLIINALSKVRVIAIKISLGMSKKQILKFNLYQGLILAFEGCIIGLLIGYGMNVFLFKIICLYIGELNIKVNHILPMELFLFSMLIGSISSLFLHKKSLKINILQSIKTIE